MAEPLELNELAHQLAQLLESLKSLKDNGPLWEYHQILKYAITRCEAAMATAENSDARKNDLVDDKAPS